MTQPFIPTIVFNGPPNSGKDEAVNYLVEHFRDSRLNKINPMMFKSKLFELTLSIFNVTEDEFFFLYDNRETKDKPTCLLKGYSPRQAMIFVSEVIIKPAMGKNYFGEIAAENLMPGYFNVFSDGGFIEEINPVYKESDGNLTIVRIHRPGCDYSNDSRGYIDNLDTNALIIDIHNNGSLENFKASILSAFNLTVKTFL